MDINRLVYFDPPITDKLTMDPVRVAKLMGWRWQPFEATIPAPTGHEGNKKPVAGIYIFPPERRVLQDSRGYGPTFTVYAGHPIEVEQYLDLMLAWIGQRVFCGMN